MNNEDNKERKLFIFFEILLFLIILFFSIRPVQNYDFWFHLKNGEYIVKTKSLPYIDTFSHSSYGGPIIPYEWLFQASVYLIYNSFGFLGIQVLVAFSLFIYIYVFRLILKEIFDVDCLFRIIFIAGIAISTYIFWVERPQIITFGLFMLVLYLVLKRTFKSKNILFLTLPIFLIWTNLHASMILGLYLLFAFGSANLVVYWREKDGSYLKAAKDLIFFGILNFIISLLPPVGIKVYELLYFVFEKRQLIATLEEFTPLYKIHGLFFIYMIVIFLAGLSFVYSLFKIKQKNYVLLLFPLIPLGLFVLYAVRQIPFSVPAILILFIPTLKILNLRLNSRQTFLLIILLLIVMSGVLTFFRRESLRIIRPLPSQAVAFSKKYLQGNMLNELPIGGYLIYHLAPKLKTFIDGRMSLKLALEKIWPDYFALTQEVISQSELINQFKYVVDKYHISWALLSTKPFTIWRKIANILREDTNWELVFFDDTDEIYVKSDGKNKDFIKKSAIKGATPFADKLYRKEKRDLARREYQHMLAIAPSSVSANALGYLLLEDKNYSGAKKYFDQALAMNSKSTSPKMNLAELAGADGNFDKAISLYREVLSDDYERKRGFVYLRLGQFLMQIGQPEEAKKVWEEGIKKTIYKDAKKKMEELLK